MADFTANFTLSEIESIDATFVITPAPSKMSELINDVNYVQDTSYVHTDNNFTDSLLNNLNNQSGVNTGDITVTDSSEIDFTLNGQDLTASIKSGSIDEIKLNSSVNASLDKADSALQSFTETDPVYTADKSFIALKSELPTATSDLTNDSGFITSADVPTTLAELTGDSTHRLVTDGEKSTWNGKQDALGYTPENIATKGVANGYCGLDSGAKVPLNNLPSTLLKYQGTWNANTNSPTLTSPDLTKISYVYNVGTAGTQFGIAFKLGDWLIYNASGVPEKSDNSDDVVSVNGKTGIVNLTKSDIGLGNVDNTSDANKPISTATQTALNLKSDKPIIQTLTDGASIAWNMANGGIGTVTLAGNRAMANPSNIVAGGRYTLIVTQDTTGTRTLTYGSYFKFPGAITPTLTSTANAVDFIEFTAINSTVLYCTNFIPDLR